MGENRALSTLNLIDEYCIFYHSFIQSNRKDNCINLCEIKFHSGPFTITKEYYAQLIEKRQRFIDFTSAKKQVFITFITNRGVAQNSYAQELVDAEVRLEQLLEG